MALGVLDNVLENARVSVLGLIDRGRTSLLDAMASKRIARMEAGDSD